MPIVPPVLDDRRYADLVDELVARIPAHTPEWTNPAPGDPGRTLVELFAWLADTLLYRANLIPERQRLAFLRLLGVPMRPATPARGVVGLTIDAPAAAAVALRAGATVGDAVPFETLDEVTVLPVAGAAYCKRPLAEVRRATADAAERARLDRVVAELRDVYALSDAALPYVTTPVFADGAADAEGFDLVGRTVDAALWVALLAPDAALVPAARDALGGGGGGARALLSVGVVPAITTPALFELVGARGRLPHVWELSGPGDPDDGRPTYLALDAVADTTAGLTRAGVVRLALPAAAHVGAPPNDVRALLEAGVGDRPPRLDDAAAAARLVAWLRLRPTAPLHALALSWVCVNAVEVDARRTVAARVLGASDGAPGQRFALPVPSVDPASLALEVEEPGQGYRPWAAVDDLALAGRDAAVFALDAEAGTVQFGDGVRGRVPDAGMRVRVARVRGGGGRAGNLPPGALTTIRAQGIDGRAVPKLVVRQGVATAGGDDAETLAEAERRIPALFRDGDRAVTEVDYRRVAADAPGVRVARVELLPRFKPQQRRPEVPGVVTVMVLPQPPAAAERYAAPAPRPDRPFLEAVHAHLDARRPLATELYVVAPEYVALGVGAGVVVRDGFGRDTVLQGVRDALRRLLWPLADGGPDGAGWPLGRAVRERELEVAVARVEGVAGVHEVALFTRGAVARPPADAARDGAGANGDGTGSNGNGPGPADAAWRQIVPAERCAPVTLELERWQLPELLSVVVLEGAAPRDLRAAPNPFGAAGVAVPVVPELC